MNLIDELFGRPKMKGKIIVEVDDDREKAETTIEGNFSYCFDNDKFDLLNYINMEYLKSL